MLNIQFLLQIFDKILIKNEENKSSFCHRVDLNPSAETKKAFKIVKMNLPCEWSRNFRFSIQSFVFYTAEKTLAPQYLFYPYHLNKKRQIQPTELLEFIKFKAAYFVFVDQSRAFLSAVRGFLVETARLLEFMKIKIRVKAINVNQNIYVLKSPPNTAFSACYLSILVQQENVFQFKKLEKTNLMNKKIHFLVLIFFSSNLCEYLYMH